MLIRYYGHVGAPSGYGDAANEMCMAILDAGLDLEISTNGEQLHSRYLPLASCIRNEEELSPPNVVIVHTLPLDCIEIVKRVRFDPAYKPPLLVAYTTWEGASAIPYALQKALAGFDEVWTPSRVTSELVRLGGISARTLPHAYDQDRSVTTGPCLRDSSVYRFYYIGAWDSRKNPEGVVRAYMRTFRAGERVELIVQSAQATSSACEVVQLSSGLPFNEMPTIRFSINRVSDEQIDDIHNRSNCYVTASRGEAWNIPAFDAMLAGHHIIAPSGLGSDEYLNQTSADRYRSTLAPAFGDVRLIPDPSLPTGHARARYYGAQGLTVREDWREPDIAELGVLMRRAFVQRPTLRVDYDIPERFGRHVVGQKLKTILTDAMARPRRNAIQGA
jgi:hypothetical protein